MLVVRSQRLLRWRYRLRFRLSNHKLLLRHQHRLLPFNQLYLLRNRTQWTFPRKNKKMDFHFYFDSPFWSTCFLKTLLLDVSLPCTLSRRLFGSGVRDGFELFAEAGSEEQDLEEDWCLSSRKRFLGSQRYQHMDKGSNEELKARKDNRLVINRNNRSRLNETCYRTSATLPTLLSQA